MPVRESQLCDEQDGLDARAAEDPYCAIDYAFYVPGQFNTINPVDVSLGPEGPRLLREIKRRARARLGRMIGLGELAALARQEMEIHNREDAALASATAILIEKLRTREITAYGLPALRNGERDVAADYVAIPWERLLHASITIDISNRVGAATADDTDDWPARRDKTFHGVQFETAEVLTLWPDTKSDDQTNGAGQATYLHTEKRGSALNERQKASPRMKRGRGRIAKYNWQPIITGLGATLHANGIPSPGDGGQARLEESVRNQFPPDQCPSESQIRSVVSKVMKAHLDSLNEEAGK
jgi:hypothetical protein